MGSSLCKAAFSRAISREESAAFNEEVHARVPSSEKGALTMAEESMAKRVEAQSAQISATSVWQRDAASTSSSATQRGSPRILGED